MEGGGIEQDNELSWSLLHFVVKRESKWRVFMMIIKGFLNVEPTIMMRIHEWPLAHALMQHIMMYILR